MQKLVKNRLVGLCESMASIHTDCMQLSDMNEIISYFSVCQDGAVAIGETLEKENESYEKEIAFLENYCEDLFHLAQKPEFDIDGFKKVTDGFLKFANQIQKIPHQLEIAFFPYQASMWDSLESIYYAFMKREDCHCSVVPIPYSEYRKKDDRWAACYDGYRMPLDIPIVKYEEYDLAAMQPDIAFIHNPYDEYNFVTRVGEAYFSKNLKKYINTLVYVPYFVNFGVSELSYTPDLSAYHYVDYMIVQSKRNKQYFENTKFYDKVLPLGSPKIDRVIHTCADGGYIPPEWEAVLAGKKIIMLNTTLNVFLRVGELAFEKWKFLFMSIKQETDVALIWRPHPLLESTIMSMKPELQQKYRDVVDYFLTESIGVLDKTPDITNTVAISDAYIGDQGSSVVTLFLAANKPVFIINYAEIRTCSMEERRKIEFDRFVKIGDQFIGMPKNHGGIFEFHPKTKQLEYITTDKEEVSWVKSYARFTVKEDMLYFPASFGQKFVAYHMKDGRFETLGTKENPYNAYGLALQYKKKIIYMPRQGEEIAIYDIEKKQFSYHDIGIKVLKERSQERVFEMLAGSVIIGNMLYMAVNYSNHLICFDLETKTYTYLQIGETSFGYRVLIYDDSYLWLSEKSGHIIRYHIESKETTVVMPPKEQILFLSVQDRIIAYQQVKATKQYIFAFPFYSNGIVRIDKNTLETTLLTPEFLYDELAEQRSRGKPIFATIQGVCSIDETRVLGYLPHSDCHVMLDLDTMQYETFELYLSEESYERFVSDMNGETQGFEKIRESAAFSKLENRHNTIADFFRDLSSGKLDEIQPIQRKYMEAVVENLDGTSGEAICLEILKKHKKKFGV